MPVSTSIRVEGLLHIKKNIEIMSVSINLTTVCRTCLSETGPMKSLFTGKSTSTENLPVNQLLTSCTSVQIEKGDGLPQQVCGKCVKLAVRCYIFKQMVEETDSQLRQHLPTVLNNQVKANIQDVNQKRPKINHTSEVLNSVENVIKDEISPADIKNVASVPPVLLLVVGKKETIENRRLSEDKRNIPREMTDKTTNTDSCPDVETLIITSTDYIKDEEGLVQEVSFGMIHTDHNYTKVLGSENTEDEKKETSYYHCKWCGEIFTAIDQYEKHVPEKHGSVFECEECHTPFSSHEELSKHSIVYHSKSDIQPKQDCEDKQDAGHLKTALKKYTINCTVCNKVFKSSWRLKTHMMVHTGERPHMCHICGKRFSQLPHLKTHYVTHTGIKNFVCEICGKKYASFSFLKNHMRHHEKIKKHKCPQCGKMFFLPSELAAHIRVHTGERPFKCSVCEKSFCSKSALKTHKLQHEKKEYVEKPFICEKCGKRFTREVFLDNHVVVHRTELQKIECKVCGREFRNRINLKMHAIRHGASRPFMCNVCGRNFREESLLVSHIRFHMRPKPFECDTCQKKFVDRGALRVHMRTHTGEKPYPCTVCDKRFTVKRSLDAHLRCHTGERPFKCTICDSSFTQRCSLQTHTLLIHNCDP